MSKSILFLSCTIIHLLESQSKSDDTSRTDTLLISRIQRSGHCSVFFAVVKYHSYPKRSNIATDGAIFVGSGLVCSQKSPTKSAESSIVGGH